MKRPFFQVVGQIVLGICLGGSACAPRPAVASPIDPPPTLQGAQLPASTETVSPATSTPAPARPAPLGIAADQAWQEAYTFVHPGDRLEITASGAWTHDPANAQFATPYGPGGVKGFEAGSLLPSAPLGSLIGRIGDGLPFLIGEQLALTVAERGKLWLSMNDSPERFAAHQGTLAVTVLYTPRPVPPGVRLSSSQDGYTLVYPEGYFVVIASGGICLTQNGGAGAPPCDLSRATGLEVGPAQGRTAAQLAADVIDPHDLNFHFDSHEMQLDGEPAMWVSRQGNGEIMTLVIAVHAGHVYTWRFVFPELVPSLGQEDQVMAEMNQQQTFYDTVIGSFEFLE